MKTARDAKEKKNGLVNCADGSSNATETESEEMYVLSEYGCLLCALSDFGIDIEDKVPTGYVGAQIVKRFMDLMVKAGYVGVNEE